MSKKKPTHQPTKRAVSSDREQQILAFQLKQNLNRKKGFLF